MEDRTGWAIVVIVGAVFLMMHAGHISAVVSGVNIPVPVVQTPVPGGVSQSGTAGLSGSTGTGNVQTFTLKSNGGQYDPAVIRVKQGTTVRIEGDPRTLSGCMAVVNIQGYGISKLIRPGDNVIEFTADKTGTFPMYCDMGIGNGKLIVE
jgi:plastocyanin